jgi:hypothetical protein
LRRIVIFAEKPDGLSQRRGAVLGPAARSPGARQTDGGRQLKDARLLLLRRRNGRFELAHGGVKIAIETKQAFATEPMDFRHVEADAGLAHRLQDTVTQLERLRRLPRFEPDCR